MRFKAAADQLSERMWLDRDVFARAAARREVDQAHEAVPEPAPVEAGLFDLIEAFQSLLRKQGRRVNLALPDPGVSLELRMSQLLDLLRARRTLTFEECFAGDRDRPALVVSFLALLELTRVGLIRIYQERRQTDDQEHGQWGPLRIFFQDPAEEEDGES
jgi:segregation and condensation protein A